MTDRRQKTSVANRIVPEAVPKLLELVMTLRSDREEINRIGSESSELPSIQLLTETAAHLVRSGESTFDAADKAWQLISDCVLVHRSKRREFIRKKDEKFLQQIPQQIVYHDAVRLITEERRIDRASDKFQRFLKYHLLGGEKIKNAEAYTAWQTAASEYNLGQTTNLEKTYSQNPSERTKELKRDGMDRLHVQYMRRVYWDSQHQQFIRVADPIEKGKSGRMGGRGKKKTDQ